MSWIFTNSDEFVNYRTKNKHVRTPHSDHITISKNGALIYISESVVQKIGLTNYAIFGYDKETNCLLIEPRLCKDKGTVKVREHGKAVKALHVESPFLPVMQGFTTR